jgi:hypothetical protein
MVMKAKDAFQVRTYIPISPQAKVFDIGPLTSTPISSITLICFWVNGWSYISVFMDGNMMTGVSLGLVALIKLVYKLSGSYLSQSKDSFLVSRSITYQQVITQPIGNFG